MGDTLNGRATFADTGTPSTSELPSELLCSIDPGADDDAWLIESLWARQAVGIVGAPPKNGKTWLVLDFALSVASGTSALGHFAVQHPGPVLLFAAEDGPRAVRNRVGSLAQARHISVDSLPLHVITADQVRLDDPAHRGRLENLLARIRPRLLVLDPLVRLHSGSEADVGHVSRLLGYLRTLQRRFELALIVTHHVSKRGGHVQPGQGLRGSSDLHAWGDSNLYLQRLKDGSSLLTPEHRGAPSADPIPLHLVSQPGGGARFELIDDPTAEADRDSAVFEPEPRGASRPGRPLQERVLRLLRRADRPLSQVVIRRRLRVQNQHLTNVLRQLQTAGDLEHLGRMKGWRVPPSESAASG